MKIWMIIILSLIGSHRVQSQQLLVNTTCLELAKPSNQQLRLTCSNPSEYHCLLDETFTKEFEVCREWKWIPGGRCAYFNSYGRGNIDERNCNRKINLTCSDGINQFSSAENTKYTACYVKKEISTSLPVTTSPTGTQSDGGNPAVNGTSDGGNATSSSNIIDRADGAIISEPVVNVQSREEEVTKEKTMEKECEESKDTSKSSRKRKMSIQKLEMENLRLENTKQQKEIKKMELEMEVLQIKKNFIMLNCRIAIPIIFGIIVPLIFIAVIYFIFKRLEYRKGKPKERQSSDIVRNDQIKEMQPFLENKTEDDVENPPAERHKNEESQELSDGARNNDTAEQQPSLKSETEDTSENLPTIRHEDEIITGARGNGNSVTDDSANESNASEIYEEALSSSPDKIVKPMNSKVSTETPQKDVNEIRTNEVDSDKSAEVDIAGGSKEEEAGEEKSDDGEKDKEESTDVFDDILKSLQEKVPTTDEQGRELCTELYHLLGNEGQKLTQEVMKAVIARETGKSVKTLYNLTDQDKSKLKKLKRVMPEESHQFLKSITEDNTSIHVSYALHQIFLDEKHHPKSGWGNPVRNTDTGIGDDVQRLYRIFTLITQEISNPLHVSAACYISLLDIMIKALTRLDPNAEFKEDYKALANKLTSIKNPTLIQKMIKTVGGIVLW